MSLKVVTKYLVADEDGPIRAFYSLSEARAFAGLDRTITEIREVQARPPKPSYEDIIKKYGESPF